MDGKTALTCSDANDVLSSGNVIVLSSSKTSAELNDPLVDKATIQFDGRDKFAAH